MTSAISETTNKEFIKIFSQLKVKPSYESSFDFYSKLSNEWFEVVNEIYLEKGSFKTWVKLYNTIISDSRAKLSERKIDNGFFDRFYGSDYKVEVIDEHIVNDDEETKILPNKEKTLIEKVKVKLKKYGFDGEYEIIESKISSLKSLADRVRKVIYISEEFNIEEDMWELIKSVVVLESRGDADYIYKLFAKHLKEKHD